MEETSRHVTPNSDEKYIPVRFFLFYFSLWKKRRYIDKMYLRVRAGSGGNGCKSFLREVRSLLIIF